MSQELTIAQKNLARVCASFSLRAYPEVTLTAFATDTQVLVEADADFIFVAFRGSKEPKDFLTDGRCFMRSFPGGGRVHAGFASAWLDIKDRLEFHLKTLPDRPLVITGHSLGGALALLAARYLARQGFPICQVMTFGGPRVGDAVWRDDYNAALLPRTLRFVKQYDPVPHIPVPGLALPYRHAGREVYLPEGGEYEVDRPFAKVLMMDAWAFFKAWQEFRNGDFWLGDDIAVEHGITDYLRALNQL